MIYKLGTAWATICWKAGWVIWVVVNVLLALIFILPSVPYGLIKKDWRITNTIMDINILLVILPLQLIKVTRLPNLLGLSCYGEYMDLDEVRNESIASIKRYWTGE